MSAAIEPIRAFAPYTDAEQLRALLQGCSAELFGSPVTLASCTLLDSLYKTYAKPSSLPKSTLSICFRVGLATGGGAIFYARVHLEGRSRAAWEQIDRPGTPSEAVVVHLPALDMIVWRFPYDPSIRHLPDALLPERVRHRLPFHRLPPGLDVAADLTHLSAEPVKYYPQKCCTTRYRLRWGDADAPAAAQSVVVFGKTYSDERGRDVHQRLQHYWRAAEFRSCRPLGYDAAIRTVWTLGIEGAPLPDVIDRSNYRHYLRQVGRGLAAVHATAPGDLGNLDTVSVTELQADFVKKIDKLGRACPPCAVPLGALLEPVQRGAAHLSANARPCRVV